MLTVGAWIGSAIGKANESEERVWKYGDWETKCEIVESVEKEKVQVKI